MNPSFIRRWSTSRYLTRLCSSARLDAEHVAYNAQRIKSGASHRIDYFHQVDDAYSYLAAQVLRLFTERYEVDLHCHLVSGPEGNNIAEPKMLSQLSTYDAHLIADAYGLDFPLSVRFPDPGEVLKTNRLLANRSTDSFVALAPQAGRALWSGSITELDKITESCGMATVESAGTAVALGTKLQRQLKHYSGAMFYYGDEWFWGVDRLHHLERRLTRFGAARHPNLPLIAPRPQIIQTANDNGGKLTLEFFVSLRSPYTAIAFDRTIALSETVGVRLKLRPVLPMVMRGVPATREKGAYIFSDAAREARAADSPFGGFYDPIGAPVRRCYALYPWAEEQGKGVQLFSSFLRHAFVMGVNTGTNRGLRKVVELAGLNWSAAKSKLTDNTWEDVFESNRLAMYEAGLWGVPSYRLIDQKGDQILSVWGQDRLWLVSQVIAKTLDVKTPESFCNREGD